MAKYSGRFLFSHNNLCLAARCGIDVALGMFQLNHGFEAEEDAVMLRQGSKSLAVLTLVVVGLASTASAQGESAIIQATATVSTSLAITGSQDLRFGVVIPAINKTVDKSATGQAGEWIISGTSSAEIQLTFTLPDSLQHATQPVGMNISFSSTDASWDDGSGGGQTSPSGTLNPNSASAERLGVAGGMTVWIGGTVIPDLSQTGGDYAADITLTVAYTGS